MRFRSAPLSGRSGLAPNRRPGFTAVVFCSLVFPVLSLFTFACKDTGSKVIERFGDLYIGPNGQRVFQTHYLGIPIWQAPGDIQSIQEIIHEQRPDIIIEAGTAHGGLALYMAVLLDQLQLKSRIISVDINPKTKQASTFAAFQKYVTVIKSGSTSPAILKKLRRMTRGKKVLVILDSDHADAHVLRELRGYAPFVKTGGYIIVCDTIIDRREAWIRKWARFHDKNAKGGPALAVRKFLKTHPDFSADATREKFLFTLHPGGYLKRIR